MFCIKRIRLHNGESAIAVAEFNDGFSHIIEDDHCWCLINGAKTSAWLFPEAVEHLRQLSTSPDDYPPLQEAIKNHVDLF